MVNLRYENLLILGKTENPIVYWMLTNQMITITLIVSFIIIAFFAGMGLQRSLLRKDEDEPYISNYYFEKDPNDSVYSDENNNYNSDEDGDEDTYIEEETVGKYVMAYTNDNNLLLKKLEEIEKYGWERIVVTETEDDWTVIYKK